MSLSTSTTGRDSPVVFAPNSDSEEWLRQWQSVLAKDLIDSPVVAVDAETTVEDACEALLSNQTSCIAVKSLEPDSSESPYLGLFDFADVNAFLTLAAIRHTIHPDFLAEDESIDQIVTAAKNGRVPVHLISDLSEKNPLKILPETSTIVELLEVFSRGTHRVLIHSSASTSQFIGMVSDRSLLTHFHAHAKQSLPLHRFLCNSLHSLALPSLNLRSSVVCCTSTETVLDAMKLMSEQGVSSVAVIEGSPPAPGALLSAVSVTDIGKTVVPSQSNQILSMPLHQFVALIKEPNGSTDGADHYPVYSVSAASTLGYTMEKILATTAHRVFVSEDIKMSPLSPATIPAAGSPQLRGVVSVVDVLSLFARLANLPDIDPTRMQRQRRESSASASARSPVMAQPVPHTG